MKAHSFIINFILKTMVGTFDSMGKGLTKTFPCCMRKTAFFLFPWKPNIGGMKTKLLGNVTYD